MFNDDISVYSPFRLFRLCVRYHGGVGGVQHGGAVAVEERSHLKVLHLVEGHRGDLLVQDICKMYTNSHQAFEYSYQ
jgi:hypothetical protein